MLQNNSKSIRVRLNVHKCTFFTKYELCTFSSPKLKDSIRVIDQLK
jgi:hypothetical protein